MACLRWNLELWTVGRERELNPRFWSTSTRSPGWRSNRFRRVRRASGFAGALTRAAATAVFAAAHLAWFASWILINSGRVTLIEPFDPYPFSLLTMIVSLEAIFLSPSRS